MNGFDIEDLRKNSNWQGYQLCDKPLTFFYDETENLCKFYLTDTGVNDPSALSKDFVLGGIMYEEYPEGIDELFNKFNLQTNELKYIKISRNKSFEQILISKRITLILDWLLEKNIYIHFSSLGNLYYALADIIDSIVPNNLMDVNFINDLKSELHQFCKKHFEKCFPILNKYNYPNIQTDQIKSFVNDFILFLEENELPENCNIIAINIIKQLLKEAAKRNSLIFIQDNENKILIDDYFNLYQERCYLYKYSFHHFDNENEVEKKMQRFQLYENGFKFVNYDFLKSTDNKFIQLSDVWVGLLCDLFLYLDRISYQEIHELKNKRLLSNMAKLYRLIMKSNSFHPMLIKMISDKIIRNERLDKLELFYNLFYIMNGEIGV